MIYSPEVPVGATPPANYPPTLSARKELKAIAFFSTASVTAELLLAAPPYIPAGSVGFAALALLCTASFAVVSGVHLGRAHYFGSRYARADGGGGTRCFEAQPRVDENACPPARRISVCSSKAF